MGEKPVLTFGEELRRERLIRDVSLEEISAATKISVRLLKALEGSDLDRLPAPVFTRGFIRAYARHLGIDADEMVNAFLADTAPNRGQEDASPKTGRTRSRFLRGRRAAAGTIVVSVTVVLLLLGLIARPQRHGGPGTTAAVRRPVAPVSFKNVAISPGPAPSIQEPAIEPTQTPGVRLVLEFDADSWTEVRADGSPVFTGLIRRGSRREFEAREGFRLTLGNAGGVRVIIDGRPLEPLGGSGQVVRDLPLPVPGPTIS
jgi:cytoskeleton protein RodZ